MGPGYESMKINYTVDTNGHKYFVGKHDVYLYNGNLSSTAYIYYRIDSLNGNLLNYNNQNHSECLSDSLNSSRGDSAYCCYNWYRYDTSSYYIFNQNFQAKLFTWSNYFEAGGFRKYAKGIGRVRERNQAVMYFTELALKGCLINGVLYGDTSLVGIIQISSEVPQSFFLSQNYPNPFNPSTKIRFALPKSSFAKLVVYDMLGREIETIVNEQLNAGTYEADWDADKFSSGVYFYQLSIFNEQLSIEYQEMKKMVLIK